MKYGFKLYKIQRFIQKFLVWKWDFSEVINLLTNIDLIYMHIYTTISEPAVPGCPYSEKIDKTKEGEDETGHVIPYQEVEDSTNTEGQLEVCT